MARDGVVVALVDGGKDVTFGGTEVVDFLHILR